MRTVNNFTVKNLFVSLILLGSLSFCNLSSFFQAAPERSLSSSRLKSKVPRRERQRLDDASGFGMFSVFDKVFDYRCYEDSNYLKEFQLVAKPPSEAEVERGLAKLNMITLASFEKKNRGYQQHARIQEVWESGDVCAKCVLLYTSNDIYNPLHHALRSDSKDLLHWMPFISAVNHYISHRPPGCPSVVWRGSKVKNEVVAKLKIGSCWRVPFYLSTSESQGTATNFQGTYMIKFNLPEGVGRNIETVSFYPNEGEVLLPPYTAVALKKKTSSELEYDVLNEAQVTKVLSSGTKNVPGKGGPFNQILRIPTGPVCKGSAGSFQ